MLAAITVAAWAWDGRAYAPKVAKSEPRVWLDSRDQKAFAGQWVALDLDTNEVLANDFDRAAVDIALLSRDPERRPIVFHCPEDSRDPIHVDLKVE